jgi:ribosomal protein S27AE
MTSKEITESVKCPRCGQGPVCALACDAWQQAPAPRKEKSK